MPDQEFNREQIIAKPLTRSVDFLTRDASIDTENRTCELSFSTEEPIYHWFGYLILDHSAGSCRLDRINKAGPLLWMHNRSQQIGAVSNVRLDKDKKGRCTAKFSRVGLGAEKFQDVEDEICRTTSFGFWVYDLEPEPGKDGKQRMIDGEPVYRCRDWEPFEVSLEPIPADTDTGVDRSLDLAKPEANEILNKTAPADTRGANSTNTTENEVMPNENPNPATPPETNDQTRTVAAPATAPPAAAPTAQNPVITRVAEFGTFGEMFTRGETNFGEFARDYAVTNPNASFEELGRAIMTERAKNQSPIQTDSPESIAQRSGQQAIEETADSYRGGPLKSFKGADAKRNALRAGHFLRAKLYGDEASIRYCRENNISLERTHSGSNNSTGGIFVTPEIENAIIDLRIEYGVVRRNANIVPMSSDTKLVNRRKGGLTAHPSGAGQTVDFSDTDWDQIELIARKWKVLTKLEDELDEDNIINFADTLVSEIAYAFTYAEDNAAFNGDGSSAYHGIVGIIPKFFTVDAVIANIKGLKVASGNAWSEITREDLLGVVGLLPQFARKSGNVKWYCSHEFWANVLERIATAAGGVTHAEIEGELKEMFFGKPVEIVEVMPHVEGNSQIPLLYGNLKQTVTFGDRRGVTIKMTDTNDKDFEKDLQTFKGTERFDINVHEVGDTSAAGPLVGLVTAPA